MAEQKKKIKSVLDQIRETFPTDESLQKSKKDRGEAADTVTDYLAQAGFPTAGAVAGTAIDMTKDLIPNTQEEYMESLASSIGGNMGTIGKKAAAPIAKEAVKEGETIISKLLARGPKLSKVSGAPSPLTGAGPDLKHALVNDPVLLDSLRGKSTSEAQAFLDSLAKQGKNISGPTQTAGTTKVKTTDMTPFEYVPAPKKRRGAPSEVSYETMNPKKAIPKPSDLVYDAKAGTMRKRLPGETD